MKKWLLLFFLAIVLVMGGAIATGFNRLTTSIFGPASGVSKSMDGYEVVLRNAFWFSDGEPKAPGQFKEWKLVVPRAYLVNEIGSNGAIESPENTKGSLFWDWFAGRHYGLYSARLDTVLDSKSLELRPAVLADKKELSGSFVGIKIVNGGEFPIVTVRDYCVREDDVRSYFAIHASGVPTARLPASVCYDVMQRCHINTILDGWRVTLTVSRPLYNQSDEMCRISLAFLNKYTTKRDEN